jgi:hypothetical protein
VNHIWRVNSYSIFVPFTVRTWQQKSCVWRLRPNSLRVLCGRPTETENASNNIKNVFWDKVQYRKRNRNQSIRYLQKQYNNETKVQFPWTFQPDTASSDSIQWFGSQQQCTHNNNVRNNAAANNYSDKGFITLTKLEKRSVVLLTVPSFQQVSFNW